MTQHTPGPCHTGGRYDLVIYTASGMPLGDARHMGNKITIEEMQANARLWAAAPDLLAALEMLLTTEFGAGPDAYETAHIVARAAIAKAVRSWPSSAKRPPVAMSTIANPPSPGSPAPPRRAGPAHARAAPRDDRPGPAAGGGKTEVVLSGQFDEAVWRRTMTNHYTDLAHAKDELRRAKDHEQTIRAIVEGPAQIFGKSADDRKRELALLLAQNKNYTQALDELRAAEYAADLAQAAIDTAEAERREREWAIRARLAAALERLHLPKTDDDIDWHDLHFQTEQRKFDAILKAHELDDPESPEFLYQQRAQRDMDELFTT